MSLKALSIRHLQGNQQGNQKETPSFHSSGRKETTVDQLKDIEGLADELSNKDPGGECWQWMKENRPDLWKAHLAADMTIDEVFQEQSAEKIGAAITKTKETFASMIEAWEQRHNYKQPSFLAA